MRFLRYILFSLVLLSIQAGSMAVEPEIEKDISIALKLVFPELQITSIKETQLDDLYEVLLGAELVYMSRDGRYLVQGNILDLKERINLSETTRASARVEILKSLPSDEYIEFSPKNAKHAIYVFTDTDCGYCRRLQSEIKETNDLGIAVRYLAFPRAGIDSKTFKDMESIWCSADRNDAYANAMANKKPSKATCENPVEKQYHLGHSMGVRGTPSVYLEDGSHIGGYLPPEEIAKAVSAQ